jgi:hypothetical protein
VSSFDEFFPQSAPPFADWDIEDLERAILARLSGASFGGVSPHEPNIHIHLRDANGETIGTANGTASAIVSEDGDLLFNGFTLGDLVLDGTLVPVRFSLVDAAEKDHGLDGKRGEPAAGFPFDQVSMAPDPGLPESGLDRSFMAMNDDHLRFTKVIVSPEGAPWFAGEPVPAAEKMRHLGTPVPLVTAPGELTIGFDHSTESEGQVGDEHGSLTAPDSASLI